MPGPRETGEVRESFLKKKLKATDLGKLIAEAGELRKGADTTPILTKLREEYRDELAKKTSLAEGEIAREARDMHDSLGERLLRAYQIIGLFHPDVTTLPTKYEIPNLHQGIDLEKLSLAASLFHPRGTPETFSLTDETVTSPWHVLDRILYSIHDETGEISPEVRDHLGPAVAEFVRDHLLYQRRAAGEVEMPVLGSDVSTSLLGKFFGRLRKKAVSEADIKRRLSEEIRKLSGREGAYFGRAKDLLGEAKASGVPEDQHIQYIVNGLLQTDGFVEELLSRVEDANINKDPYWNKVLVKQLLGAETAGFGFRTRLQRLMPKAFQLKVFGVPEEAADNLEKALGRIPTTRGETTQIAKALKDLGFMVPGMDRAETQRRFEEKLWPLDIETVGSLPEELLATFPAERRNQLVEWGQNAKMANDLLGEMDVVPSSEALARLGELGFDISHVTSKHDVLQRIFLSQTPQALKAFGPFFENLKREQAGALETAVDRRNLGIGAAARLLGQLSEKDALNLALHSAEMFTRGKRLLGHQDLGYEYALFKEALEGQGLGEEEIQRMFQEHFSKLSKDTGILLKSLGNAKALEKTLRNRETREELWSVLSSLGFDMSSKPASVESVLRTVFSQQNRLGEILGPYDEIVQQHIRKLWGSEFKKAFMQIPEAVSKAADELIKGMFREIDPSSGEYWALRKLVLRKTPDSKNQAKFQKYLDSLNPEERRAFQQKIGEVTKILEGIHREAYDGSTGALSLLVKGHDVSRLVPRFGEDAKISDEDFASLLLPKKFVSGDFVANFSRWILEKQLSPRAIGDLVEEVSGGDPGAKEALEAVLNYGSTHIPRSYKENWTRFVRRAVEEIMVPQLVSGETSMEEVESQLEGLGLKRGKIAKYLEPIITGEQAIRRLVSTGTFFQQHPDSLIARQKEHRLQELPEEVARLEAQIKSLNGQLEGKSIREKWRLKRKIKAAEKQLAKTREELEHIPLEITALNTSTRDLVTQAKVLWKRARGQEAAVGAGAAESRRQAMREFETIMDELARRFPVLEKIPDSKLLSIVEGQVSSDLLDKIGFTHGVASTLSDSLSSPQTLRQAAEFRDLLGPKLPVFLAKVVENPQLWSRIREEAPGEIEELGLSEQQVSALRDTCGDFLEYLQDTVNNISELSESREEFSRGRVARVLKRWVEQLADHSSGKRVAEQTMPLFLEAGLPLKSRLDTVSEIIKELKRLKKLSELSIGNESQSFEETKRVLAASIQKVGNFGKPLPEEEIDKAVEDLLKEATQREAHFAGVELKPLSQEIREILDEIQVGREGSITRLKELLPFLEDVPDETIRKNLYYGYRVEQSGLNSLLEDIIKSLDVAIATEPEVSRGKRLVFERRANLIRKLKEALPELSGLSDHVIDARLGNLGSIVDDLGEMYLRVGTLALRNFDKADEIGREAGIDNLKEILLNMSLEDLERLRKSKPVPGISREQALSISGPLSPLLTHLSKIQEVFRGHLSPILGLHESLKAPAAQISQFFEKTRGSEEKINEIFTQILGEMGESGREAMLGAMEFGGTAYQQSPPIQVLINNAMPNPKERLEGPALTRRLALQDFLKRFYTALKADPSLRLTEDQIQDIYHSKLVAPLGAASITVLDVLSPDRFEMVGGETFDLSSTGLDGEGLDVTSPDPFVLALAVGSTTAQGSLGFGLRFPGLFDIENMDNGRYRNVMSVTGLPLAWGKRPASLEEIRQTAGESDQSIFTDNWEQDLTKWVFEDMQKRKIPDLPEGGFPSIGALFEFLKEKKPYKGIIEFSEEEGSIKFDEEPIEGIPSAFLIKLVDPAKFSRRILELNKERIQASMGVGVAAALDARNLEAVKSYQESHEPRPTEPA